MTKIDCLQIIAAADQGDVLRCLREDVNNDPSLFSTEKDEICNEILKRYGELNAAALPPAEQKPRWQTLDARTRIFKRGCKHLILCVLLASALATVSNTFASSNSAVALNTILPLPLGEGRGEGDRNQVIELSHRLSALSQIESGDDDDAIGRAGEISRYQIMPSIWLKYFVVHRSGLTDCAYLSAASNPFTAWHIAVAIMQDRCKLFETKFHRPPTNEEFYILWARPSWFLRTSRIVRHAGRDSVMARALRFSNLVNR